MTAPNDPELVIVRCQIERPDDLNGAALAGVIARVNSRSVLAEVVYVNDTSS